MIIYITLYKYYAIWSTYVIHSTLYWMLLFLIESIHCKSAELPVSTVEGYVSDIAHCKQMVYISDYIKATSFSNMTNETKILTTDS